MRTKLFSQWRLEPVYGPTCGLASPESKLLFFRVDSFSEMGGGGVENNFELFPHLSPPECIHFSISSLPI